MSRKYLYENPTNMYNLNTFRNSTFYRRHKFKYNNSIKAKCSTWSLYTWRSIIIPIPFCAITRYYPTTSNSYKIPFHAKQTCYLFQIRQQINISPNRNTLVVTSWTEWLDSNFWDYDKYFITKIYHYNWHQRTTSYIKWQRNKSTTNYTTKYQTNKNQIIKN